MKTTDNKKETAAAKGTDKKMDKKETASKSTSKASETKKGTSTAKK